MRGCRIRFPCRVASAALLRLLGFIPLARASSSLCSARMWSSSRVSDDMKPQAVASSSSKSVSRSSSSVAFSWEHEPGVSKQRHSESEATKPAAAGTPRAKAVSRRTKSASAKNQAPAPAPAVAETAHPHRHRLRVPPPPGGPGAPAASPPGRRNPRSRGVRPADDPFLSAYLACTTDGANGGRTQKLLGWAGLGLGLGFGMRGLGLSCKSSCGAVEDCVVRLAKLPGIGED